MTKKLIVFLSNSSSVNKEVALLCNEKYKDYTVLINPEVESFKIYKKEFDNNIECITLKGKDNDIKIENSSVFKPMNIICRLGDAYPVEKALSDIFKTIERD